MDRNLRCGLFGVVCSVAMAGAADADPPARRDFQFLWGVSTRQAALPEQLTLDGNIYNLNHAPVSRNCRFLYSNEVGIFPEAGPHEILLDPNYMTAHFTDLRRDIQSRIPDPNFDGPAVIDYEAWYLNWERTKNHASDGGPLDHDLDFKQDWEDAVRSIRPELLAGLHGAAAAAVIKESYEQAAMDFYVATIRECQRLRPRAKWGFYNYPPKRYLSSETPHGTIAYGEGGHQASVLNDRLSRLWEASNALYPSTYANRVTVADGVTPSAALRQNNIADDRQYIRSILREAQRLARGKPVYAVAWSRYQNSGAASQTLLNGINIRNQAEVALQTGINGLIWWDGIEFRNEYSELNTWMNTLAIPQMDLVMASRPGPRTPRGGGTPVGQHVGSVVQRGDGTPAILGTNHAPPAVMSAVALPAPQTLRSSDRAPQDGAPRRVAVSAIPAVVPPVLPTAIVESRIERSPCDWNQQGGVEPADLIDYIEAFLVGEADFDGNGVTESTDMFAFQDCFFASSAVRTP